MLFDVGDQGFVDVLYNPVEELGVDMFGQGVTGVSGLQAGQGLDICLCSRLQLPVAQPLRHVLVGHAYQLAKRHQVAIVGLQTKRGDVNQYQEKPKKMPAIKCGFKQNFKNNTPSSSHKMEVDTISEQVV